MNWPVLAGGALVLAVLTALLYWQLSLAEGAYLGRRVVTWLYDRFAPRYDAIKQFDERDEAWFLGGPLAQALLGARVPLVLDVATGTARLPLALFRQPTFNGRVVALDLSRQMLRHAAAKTTAYQDRLTLLWQDGTHLPFPDDVFDAVTCIEALEFLPDARATLAEMVRVLRLGGVLLVSNRVGPGARWMPGRTMDRQAFAALLESLSLTAVGVSAWQVDYDIAWARKGGRSSAAAPSTLPALLRCPRCATGPLARQGRAFHCVACAGRYPISDDGVIEMENTYRTG
jgi:ubiquinone/menaquinone biosynthesis C-methylase UbiE